MINTELMFSSKTDMWETPQDFFNKMNEEFHFDIDVCATPQNAKCKKYFTINDDALTQKWGGYVGVIPHMVERFANGLKKRTLLVLKTKLS